MEDANKAALENKTRAAVLERVIPCVESLNKIELAHAPKLHAIEGKTATKKRRGWRKMLARLNSKLSTSEKRKRTKTYLIQSSI